MSIKKLIFKWSLLLLLLESNIVVAQFRKYSNEFLNIGAGARGLAMGGAQAASVEDGTAGYWNPAGLANVKGQTQVNLMHSEYFAGIGKYDYASMALPTTNPKRVLGLSALRFAVDDIPNTLFLVNPDGSLNYNNIQTFSSSDYAFLLSYGQNLKSTENTTINFGANAKVIYRNVGKFAQAWGFGLDAGLQIFKDDWSFGVVAKDVTSTFNTWTFNFTEKEKEILYLSKNDIPVKSTEFTSPRVILAVSRLFSLGKKSTLLAETDLDLTFDGRRNTFVSGDPVSIDPKVGLEYGYRDILFVRGGVNNFQKGLADGDITNQKKVWVYQASVGVGFRVKSLVVDYAFANLANQSNPLFTHVFSLRLGLKKRRRSTVF